MRNYVIYSYVNVVTYPCYKINAGLEKTCMGANENSWPGVTKSRMIDSDWRNIRTPCIAKLVVFHATWLNNRDHYSHTSNGSWCMDIKGEMRDVEQTRYSRKAPWWSVTKMLHITQDAKRQKLNRKWQDYVYIQCEYKSTKQKIKHLLREENKVKENKIS